MNSPSLFIVWCACVCGFSVALHANADDSISETTGFHSGISTSVQTKAGINFGSEKKAIGAPFKMGSTQSVLKRLFDERRFEEIINSGITPSEAKSLSSEIQYYLGMAHFNAERYLEALPYFQQLLGSSDHDKAKGKWNLLLGNCYQRMGNKSLAKQHYQSTLGYIQSPWALIWLSIYEVESGNKVKAHDFLIEFVNSCDVPNLLILLRVDELGLLYSEGGSRSILALSKTKVNNYFKGYDFQTASDALRGNRMECLTTFLILIEKGKVSDDAEFSELIWEILDDLGYSKLDVYLESARLHDLNNDHGKTEQYMSLALNSYPYPFRNSELLKHCEWLENEEKLRNDPRYGFDEKVKRWVEKRALIE